MGCRLIERVLLLVVIGTDLMSVSAQSPVITSSLETEESFRRFACPSEPIVYICSGPGAYLEWYVPPILNRSEALFYRSSSELGRGFIEGSITTNLISLTDGIVSELVLNGVNSTDPLLVFCRTGIDSLSTTPTSVQYLLLHSQSPLPENSVSIRMIPGGCDVAVMELTWPSASNDFDLKYYVVTVYVDGEFLERFETTSTTVRVSFSRQSGTKMFGDVMVVNQCNQTSPAVRSTELPYTFLECGPVAALQIAIAVVSAILVFAVALLIICGVCVCYYTGDHEVEIEQEKM